MVHRLGTLVHGESVDFPVFGRLREHMCFSDGGWVLEYRDTQALQVIGNAGPDKVPCRFDFEDRCVDTPGIIELAQIAV